jgi:predicted dehydrogenase
LGYADIKTIEISHLLEAVAGKGKVAADFRDGVKALEVCDAILRSADAKEWIKLG